MSNKLFEEFSDVSSKEWKQKIQADLKGADYNDTLIWKTNEGIHVKPFYHADEFSSIPNMSSSKATQWHICETIFVADVQKSNTHAKELLNRGAESLKFIIPSEDVSIEILLKDIDSSKTQLFFELQFIASSYVNKIFEIASKERTVILTDIIGNLSRSGNWFTTLQEDHKEFEAIVNKTSTMSVDVALYQNAGANMVQQLAYALAHVNEYLNHLSQKDSLQVIFNVSVGTNYFFEIAKLRALRTLWHTLSSEYNITSECHIFVVPTKRNKTLYDYNTNLLRTTTECMSSILGGANTINNLAYDAIYHKDNEFGSRISRNQLLVLKHESYFDKVNNPSDGAYYIESLSQQLAEKALELFKDIEAHGGFLKQLKEGTIQRKIKESAEKEQTQFNTGEEVLLGTNKHPNPNDKMKQDLELYPFVKTNPRKTLIEPIIEKRLAETLEKNRLKSE
ncbi:methylmalonyl-CoA mutase subunit beta [Xanthomarina sp. F2636L]|uniref:methylmalonyl-CoA mutase subunit beta n=1 Tax=Xanthomarina sp. F2636L TaxID=2996018 RepID=UPI00225E2DA1|nr:methylmalonyl-CoA mutase subunit beta [Xanthomarina sp. F2636L]MCX7550053.1 methylmalonyl-CoA mutase subunit beta [Xanthomarina sp. F2636L]